MLGGVSRGGRGGRGAPPQRRAPRGAPGARGRPRPPQTSPPPRPRPRLLPATAPAREGAGSRGGNCATAGGGRPPRPGPRRVLADVRSISIGRRARGRCYYCGARGSGRAERSCSGRAPGRRRGAWTPGARRPARCPRRELGLTAPERPRVRGAGRGGRGRGRGRMRAPTWDSRTVGSALAADEPGAERGSGSPLAPELP